MSLYEYQRSRSFTDLGQKVTQDSTFSDFFFLETAWPIEVKFYVEPPKNGGTKVCSTGPSYMTKMATMAIYGKNFKKSFPPEPKG